MSAGQSVPKFILWNTESNSGQDGLEPHHLKNCLLSDDVQDVHHLACIASQQGSKVDLGNELPIKALLPGREHQGHFQGGFNRSNQTKLSSRSRLGGSSSLS